MPSSKSNSRKNANTKPKKAGSSEVIQPAKAEAPPIAVPVAAVAPPAPVPPATTVPDTLKGPDAIAAYQALYDTLGRAYWEASDLHSKDTIQGARDAIYDILTDLNAAKLAANTAAYLALAPKVVRANKTLTQIKEDISGITKNITTAANVVAAVTRVLNIAAMF